MPEEPGIYLFLNKKGDVIYVGKAKNLRNRVSSYFHNSDLGPKTTLMVSQINKIKTIIVQSEVESLLLEATYIKKYNPKYNVKLTDKKAYPLIRITIKDTYPKILTARRQEDKKSVYFGPYPNVNAMGMVLKIIRRIFPFQSVINHPSKICLYNHLGLCPCPAVTGEKIQYRKNIKYIIQFLNGKTDKIIKNLKKDRDELSKNEKFEKAAEIQKKIDAIKLITGHFYKPFEYEVNPNLRQDIRQKEMQSLKSILIKNNINVASLKRIECFDVSNIQGKFATGSMVVFIDGEKDKASYRRFKIKRDTPNDFAMIKEILTRRLRHNEWEKPDLLVIDGGKGQVGSAKQAINESGINLNVIGLAKRDETIVTPDLKEITLPKDSDGLKFLMRIRDESHRFAISYHKKLRGRFIFL